MVTSVRIVARGRVQAVGYRWFVRDAAEAARVTGWVRNLPDGSVAAQLHGEPHAVEAVVAAMRQGPPLARVHELDVREIDEDAPLGFEIRAT